MKKAYKIIIILGLYLIVFNSYSQQDTQYTQYMYNMNILNPAYAGSKNVLSIGILGRTQWMNINGAPKTATLSVHSPIKNSFGVGLSVIYDEIGPVKKSNVYADASYTINLSEGSYLAFGLKAGFTFLNIGLLKTLEEDNLNIPISKTAPNFGAGLYYYTDTYYVGFSVPNILETKHIKKSNELYNDIEASEKMHFYLTAGYVFDVSESVKLKPSTMVKATEGSPLSIDLSLNALINDKMEVGLSHRFDDSISAMLGFNVNRRFRIGYAYDYTISNLGAFSKSGHEIMLLYDFYELIIRTPRFF